MRYPLLNYYYLRMLSILAFAVCIYSACSFSAEKVEFKMDKPTDREAASGALMEKVTTSRLIPEGKNTRYYAKMIGKPINTAWLAELQGSANAIPFMKRLALPQAPTERAKWYSSISPEKVLSSVRTMLVDYSRKDKLSAKIALDDLECESKVGPQGGHPAIHELMPKLMEYFGYYTKERAGVMPDLKSQSETFKSEAWIKAKEAVIKELKLSRRLRPASPRVVINTLRKRGQLITNCGFVPGAVFKKRNDPKVIDIVNRLCLTKDGWKQPAILGERSTRGKTRFIFMASMATNVKEQQYLFPLMEHIRKLKLPAFSAWEGNQNVKEAMTQMFNLTAPDPKTIISTDFTGMDQRFNAACVSEIFSIIKEAFQPAYWDELDEVAKWITSVPVLFSDEKGTIWETNSEHGMPSGSGYTNGSETLFDAVMWKFAKAILYRVLGDDGAALVPWESSQAANQFSRIANSLGMTANPDKQLVSKDKAHYLQRYYYREYKTSDGLIGGVYPIMLAFNSLMFPERWHDPRKWSKYMESIRNLMITENTCDHPLFEEFATFVGRGDKYIKDFLKLSSKDLDKVEQVARSLPGFIPSYNQEKQDKRLYSFKTYQLWQKKFA